MTHKPHPKREKAMKPTCGGCGSDRVMVDATAVWSPADHGMIMTSWSEDSAMCLDCEDLVPDIVWVDPKVRKRA